MGERNKTTQAIILTVRLQGENNRIVQVLTPEDGILSLVLYGGPKSRLRSLVQPFNSGTLFYYSDEAKKQRKISDFDVRNCHLTFRTNLFKMWAADLAAEIIIKTKCGGDSESAFTLLKAVTDGMDAVDEEEARLGLLRFLWRYIGLLGVQPEIKDCVLCKGFLLGEEKKNTLMVYSSVYSGFICADCLKKEGAIQEENGGYFLDTDGATYLAAINELKPGKVRSISIKESSANYLKRFLFYLIDREAGPLKTLESGLGIL